MIGIGLALALVVLAIGWLVGNVWLRAGSRRMPRGGGEL